MTDGLFHGREIDAAGRARPFDLAAEGAPAAGWRWLHLDRASAAARDWLRERSGLSGNAVHALLEEDTRPRAERMEGGLLAMLRAVNLDPEAEPEDMISLRLFVADRLMISLTARRIPAVDARVAALDEGRATELGACVLALIEGLRREAEPVLDDLQREVDGFELASLKSERPLTPAQRNELNDARHDAIMLHRHLAPQAAAVERVARLRPDWLSKTQREALRGEAEAFGRIAEDLDAVRARSVVIGDEAALRVGEQTNQLVLTLSVVSMIFLPLTFLSGLLGVNLAGIPFAEAQWAFAAFAFLLLLVAGATAWLLRRLGFI